MRKLHIGLVLAILCFAPLATTLKAQTGLGVELAAFLKAVDQDYFQGLDFVQHLVDHNEIHRYYRTGFDNKASAEAFKAQAQKLGFNARLIDYDERNSMCGACAAPVSAASIRHIFFDFDRAALRSASRQELDKLATVLKQNPTYSAMLLAHTDAKGSNEYNQALSKRRADNARAYLLQKGIPASTIKSDIFGESNPLAKNEVNGQDTEEGRQYNRRVELYVLDANGRRLNDMSERISVPTYLQE